MRRPSNEALLSWIELTQKVVDILAEETLNRLTYMPPKNFNDLLHVPTDCHKALKRIKDSMRDDDIIDNFSGSCNISDDIDNDGLVGESGIADMPANEIVHVGDEGVAQEAEEGHP